MGTPANAISALDVAEYILQSMGPIGRLKLQKLVSYSQAWSLAWHGHPIFVEPIQAWIQGPVIPQLFQVHGGESTASVSGVPARLSQRDCEVIDEIIEAYGPMSGAELRDLTHAERPWVAARAGLPANKPSVAEITHASMRDFYRDRPCGLSRPVRDTSIFSLERVRASRAAVERGDVLDLDDFARAVSGQGP